MNLSCFSDLLFVGFSVCNEDPQFLSHIKGVPCLDVIGTKDIHEKKEDETLKRKTQNRPRDLNEWDVCITPDILPCGKTQCH